jgi:hypothetical protein
MKHLHLIDSQRKKHPGDSKQEQPKKPQKRTWGRIPREWVTECNTKHMTREIRTEMGLLDFHLKVVAAFSLISQGKIKQVACL